MAINQSFVHIPDTTQSYSLAPPFGLFNHQEDCCILAVRKNRTAALTLSRWNFCHPTLPLHQRSQKLSLCAGVPRSSPRAQESVCDFAFVLAPATSVWKIEPHAVVDHPMHMNLAAIRPLIMSSAKIMLKSHFFFVAFNYWTHPLHFHYCVIQLCCYAIHSTGSSCYNAFYEHFSVILMYITSFFFFLWIHIPCTMSATLYSTHFRQCRT